MEKTMEFHLHPKESGIYTSFQNKKYKNAIEFIIHFLDDLYCSDVNGLSCSLGCIGDREFAHLHFQQVGNLFFLQVFLSGEVYIGESEGWHNLVEDNFRKKNDHKLMETIWNEPRKSDYFEARFAEGVLFSKDLLVNKETVQKSLDRYDDDISLWLKTGRWENLGLI